MIFEGRPSVMAVLVMAPGVDLSITNYEKKNHQLWWENGRADSNVRLNQVLPLRQPFRLNSQRSTGKSCNFVATLYVKMELCDNFYFYVLSQGEKQQGCLIHNSWHHWVLAKRSDIRSEGFWGMLFLFLFCILDENVWRSLWWNRRRFLVRHV